MHVHCINKSSLKMLWPYLSLCFIQWIIIKYSRKTHSSCYTKNFHYSLFNSQFYEHFYEASIVLTKVQYCCWTLVFRTTNTSCILFWVLLEMSSWTRLQKTRMKSISCSSVPSSSCANQILSVIPCSDKLPTIINTPTNCPWYAVLSRISGALPPCSPCKL